jgi:phosphate transport system substrate-binding protein
MKTPYCSEDLNRSQSNFASRLSLVLVGAILAGCSPSQDNRQPAPGDKIVIKGSNTVGEELAPRLITEYKKQHPKVSIELETKGSASGFWGLIGGMCDIAASSRGMITDEQNQATSRGLEFEDNVIGSYSVAVVVNAACPVTDLNREQVRDLFTGAIQNWKEVGGPDAPVHLFIRNPISGTYLGFREMVMEDKPYATHTTAFTNYAAIVDAVSKDPAGIGYSCLQLASKPGVKAVSIGGVPASAAAVKEGKYPYARKLHLFTNKASEPPLANDFVLFIQSPRGQVILDEMGFTPAK